MNFGFCLKPVYERLGVKPGFDLGFFFYPPSAELRFINGIQVNKTAFLFVHHPYLVNKFTQGLCIKGIKQEIQGRPVFIRILKGTEVLKTDLQVITFVWHAFYIFFCSIQQVLVKLYSSKMPKTAVSRNTQHATLSTADIVKMMLRKC